MNSSIDFSFYVPCGYSIVRALEFKSLKCWKIPWLYLRIWTLKLRPIKAKKYLKFKDFSRLYLFRSLFMAGAQGFEPRKCQSQSLMPYRLAMPQYFQRSVLYQKSLALSIPNFNFFKKNRRCKYICPDLLVIIHWIQRFLTFGTHFFTSWKALLNYFC